MARRYSAQQPLPYKLFAALIMLLGCPFYIPTQANSAGDYDSRASAAAQADPEPLLFDGVLNDDPDQIRQAVAQHGPLTVALLNTALDIAALEGHQHAVAQLLKAGAPPNYRNIHGLTPLIAAAGVRGNAAVIRQLLDAGAERKAATVDGRTALSEASAIGDRESVSTLIGR